MGLNWKDTEPAAREQPASRDELDSWRASVTTRDCICWRRHASDSQRAMMCVDGALVFGFRSQRLGARIPNELVAELVGRDRKRLGVCGVDPMCGDALDQLEAGHALGMVGTTLSPACQGFHPAHSAAMRVYERCAELTMPLFVTTLEPLTPNSVLEFGRPVLWDEVAQSFPNMPIVIGNLGYPWIDETLVMLGKHPNVFADIAGVASRPWQLYNALLSATSLGVMDKLLFGSGFPFDTPAKAIEALYSVNSYSHGTQLEASSSATAWRAWASNRRSSLHRASPWTMTLARLRIS